MEKKYFIASVSCGNDSMAMVQELVRRGYPLDEIVFYSNGMDFDCIWKRYLKVDMLPSTEAKKRIEEACL